MTNDTRIAKAGRVVHCRRAVRCLHRQADKWGNPFVSWTDGTRDAVIERATRYGPKTQPGSELASAGTAGPVAAAGARSQRPSRRRTAASVKAPCE